MDAPVWKSSMCNELGRLSQGCKEHVVTDTMEFIFHKYKPNYRRATCVRAVCDIQTQKTDTHRTILTAGRNLIDYPGEVSTPTSYLFRSSNPSGMHICIHCVIFLWNYICLQILVVSLKSGSLYIHTCPSGCSGRNPLRPCTYILIWRLIWRLLYGFLWWSSLMLVCWPLLDNILDSLLKWVLFYGSLFFVVGYRIQLSHRFPFCPLLYLYGR